MGFQTYGPFEVPMHVELKAKELGRLFEGNQIGLQDAAGVYVFVDRVLRIPVYIGKAFKNSFITRLSAHLNGSQNSGLRSFLDQFDGSSDGVALVLIAFEAEDGTLPKAEIIGDEDRLLIGDMEKLLIKTFRMINPDIVNLTE